MELGYTKIKGKEEFTLRKFQENTIDFFKSSNSYLFLSAPTGSGKTFTLLAPLFSNILYGTRYDGALGIYPTKPLTVDQIESLKSMLGRLGNIRSDRQGVTIYDLDFAVVSNNIVNNYRGSVGLVLLTRDNIEKLKKSLSTESGQNVLDIIRKELLTEKVDYLITLAVPEYPYLMLSHMYRSYHDLSKILDLVASGGFVYRAASNMLSFMNNENELRKYVNKITRKVRELVGSRSAERELANLSSALLSPVLFFDEFHTWGFYELPTAISLVLLHRLMSLMSVAKGTYRVVFSSATPNQYVADMLKKIAGETSVEMIDTKLMDCASGTSTKVRGRTTIELYPIETKMLGSLSWVELDSYLPSIVENRKDEILKYERAIVFGRRVWSVEEAANTFLKQTGFVPAVITGFIPTPPFQGKEELVDKKTSGKLYVFGNYAVELGIDLQNIQYSIVVASNLGEMIQRMGRNGRGGLDSKIVIPIPNNYAKKIIQKLGKVSNVQYSELIEAFSWFMPGEHIIKKLGNEIVLKKKIGKLRMYIPLATYILISVLRYRDKPVDLEPVLRDFENIVQLAGINNGFFSWLKKRVSKNPGVLVELASFRLSPSIPYVRDGSTNQVDGESNPITILSNYDVEFNTYGEFRLIIKKSRRGRIKDITTITMENPNRELLSSLNEVILPSKLALELIEKMLFINQQSKIIEILRKLNTPVYIVYPKGGNSILEILRAYGQAIALEHSDVAYAYILLL